MQPSTEREIEPRPQAASAPTVSPSRKRTRESGKKTTKLDAPPPRRLRMRIDRSARIWAGRCGCKSPHCMADEFEFSSDTGVSDDSDDSDCEDSESRVEMYDQPAVPRATEDNGQGSQRPPQDPDDLVPMLLHLMLMM